MYFFKRVIQHSDEHPCTIHTDQHSSLIKAVKLLKKQEVISEFTEHITSKSSNNRIESDHFRVKRIIKPMLGFKSFHTASRCIKGLEAMLMVVKNQTLRLTKSARSNQVYSSIIRCLLLLILCRPFTSLISLFYFSYLQQDPFRLVIDLSTQLFIPVTFRLMAFAF